jgi:hypothetical protein
VTEAPRFEQRHAGLISPGVVRPLETIRFHSEAPFVRRQMAGGGLHDELGLHVAVHEIYQPAPRRAWNYCDAHQHTVHELNLLLSPGHLRYEVELDDERYEVTAPASILIPPGLSHRANLIEGTGLFVVVVGSSDYERTFPAS